MPRSTREQSYRNRHESLQPLQRFGELIGQPAAIAALPRSPSQGPDNRISGDKIIGKGRLPVAIKAMAAKLARLACRRLRFGRHSSAEERSFTTASTANCKSTISSTKPPISGFKSSKLRQRSFRRDAG